MLQNMKDKWSNSEVYQDLPSPIIKNLDGTSISDDLNMPAYQSYGVFPLLFSNRLIGSLRLISKQNDFFSRDNQMLIQSYANWHSHSKCLYLTSLDYNKQLHGLFEI
jgi:hypothetical protein